MGIEFLIWAGVSGAAAVFGYIKSRKFVRKRLRFVDAARSPAAPLVVGAVCALVTLPLAILPVITPASAVLFGLGVGSGVFRGGKDVKRLPGS